MGDNFPPYKGRYRSRKRKQAGGFLVEAAGTALATSAAKTLIKTFIAMAVRYGLHAVERKLKGPDANTWMHRIMYWIPNTMLTRLIMGRAGDESTAIIGISALMYVNNYLNKQRGNEQNETVENTKRLKTEQERIDAQEAKTQEDARNALMRQKPKPVKKEAKMKSTKSKAAKKATKSNATVQA